MALAISVPQAIAAVAGLGTASYGLVDASKALKGGVSNAGFGRIRRVMTFLFPEDASANDRQTPLAFGSVLDTLKANWINGTSLNDQKMIAKSLIQLRLNTATAGPLAQKMGVDGAILTSVAIKIATGAALTQQEADLFGRCDLILSTALDEGYQRADQCYRNACQAQVGHNRDDVMVPWDGRNDPHPGRNGQLPRVTPGDLLNVAPLGYSYDALIGS